MNDFVESIDCRTMPRIPSMGMFDLTFRCNNNCRHCWIRIPENATEEEKELDTHEIRSIIKESRELGCGRWAISGGEPMIRPDFPEIFDFITQQCIHYSLNTNGTLITPQIAKLLRRVGDKMVALLGATAEVHDYITRNPGSFEATMQGFAYLREAGADFIVQLIPMKDNYHQFGDMIRLAETLSPRWRIGASWLYLTASGDQQRNREIKRQRLSPNTVIELDNPDVAFDEWLDQQKSPCHSHSQNDGNLFTSCITSRDEFYVTPYGQMSFCQLVQDTDYQYDLRKGGFEEAWEHVLPSLASIKKGGEEYRENCDACELRSDCRWCPAYGFLEHERYSAKVDYLCDVARLTRKRKDKWRVQHRRFYRLAGITLQVEADLPIGDDTFNPKFKLFEVDDPGEDTIRIRHHFYTPDVECRHSKTQVYSSPIWTIYRDGNSWIYEGKVSPSIAVFNNDYTRCRIYNAGEDRYRRGNLHSLTLLPSDQILLCQLLADREGCYIHSSGVSLSGQGLLFVGHSEAGKSTMVKMIKEDASILCDDRVILKRHSEGYRIYGNWSHGEIPIVSAESAQLRAIFILEQADENRIEPVVDRGVASRKLLACLIKPFVTADWWEKSLHLIERIIVEVPCFTLRFTKDGGIVPILRQFVEYGCEE